LARFEFESGIVSFYFYFIFVSLENRVCLSRGVQVAGAAWRAATSTVAGVRDRCRGPGMVAQVGYSVAERSRGRVAPCAVCTWHMETRSAGFLVEP
jgi:hypothetical protein